MKVSPIIMTVLILILLAVIALREFGVITPFGGVWLLIILAITGFLALFLYRNRK